MPGKVLSPTEAFALLNQSSKQENLVRAGAIKYYDKERRCVNRGCTSPTHYEFDGVAHCIPHLLNRANDTIEMLRAAANPDHVKRILEFLEGGVNDDDSS